MFLPPPTIPRSTIVYVLLVPFLLGLSAVESRADKILDTVVYNDYFSVQTIQTTGDETLAKMIINGPSQPPPGFEAERYSVQLPVPEQMGTTNVLSVPAYSWVFGCSSVSGAMIAAYYDRNGYDDIYTGPANDGMMPMNNSTTYWPTWTDSAGTTYPNLPLAASHIGVDGRATRGSIDDYWLEYNSSDSDPWVGNWLEHTWGTAIGDYMKTSQSEYSNSDGSTSFYNFSPPSTTPLTCSAMVNYDIHNEDGTYGRKLFYEQLGYTVTDCYSQNTENVAPGGFTFTQFKAEIDSGNPVMLNLVGHTVVGIGYDDATNTIYINDTWDHSTHSMTWGGSYSGMALQSVSIVKLESTSPSTYRLSVNSTGASGVPVSATPAGYGGTTNYTKTGISPGTGITLVAPSKVGESVFNGWNGCDSVSSYSCTITITDDMTVTAAYAGSSFPWIKFLPAIISATRK